MPDNDKFEPSNVRPLVAAPGGDFAVAEPRKLHGLPRRRATDHPRHGNTPRRRATDVFAPHIKLSILMPAYDEDRTIRLAVETVLAQHYPCEIELIVIDDGSTVPMTDLLIGIDDPRLIQDRHPVNQGKGAALRRAAALAGGTHIVPFDSDLEYDPADLVGMLLPVIRGRCDVVYGTRLFGANTRYQSLTHAAANRALTLVANVLFDAYISDLHTCLKLMPLEMFRSFTLGESGFGLDTEITAYILRTGVRPFEVPVSYYSRSKAQGKKIQWRDGIDCLKILARVRGMKAAEVMTLKLTDNKTAGVIPRTRPLNAHRRRSTDGDSDLSKAS